MFGKKKKKILKTEPKITADISVMPDAFYGAKNPAVYYESKGKERVGLKGAKALHEGKMVPAAVSALFKNKKFLYISCGILFIIIISLISWYYISQTKKALQPAVKTEETQTPSPAPGLEDSAPVAMEEATSTLEDIFAGEEIEEAPDTLVSLEEQPLEFPQIFLTDSADLDSDALTDIEEELFATDSGNWDTDGDGYYDGQEVFNLYNPIGYAPVKIIDSGLVREYVNPIWQYRLYYPVNWEAGSVDPQSNQVLFSSVTGDFVLVAVVEKKEGDLFVDWFAQEAKGQEYTDLHLFTNRFQEEGWKRKDDLTAYFVHDDNVYVLIYHPGTTGFIPFRHVMQMMVQSFRPSKTLVNIPDQVPLPPAPTYNVTPTQPAEELILGITTTEE